jgi:hypothetical protein
MKRPADAPDDTAREKPPPFILLRLPPDILGKVLSVLHYRERLGLLHCSKASRAAVLPAVQSWVFSKNLNDLSALQTKGLKTLVLFPKGRRVALGRDVLAQLPGLVRLGLIMRNDTSWDLSEAIPAKRKTPLLPHLKVLEVAHVRGARVPASRVLEGLGLLLEDPSACPSLKELELIHCAALGASVPRELPRLFERLATLTSISLKLTSKGFLGLIDVMAKPASLPKLR